MSAAEMAGGTDDTTSDYGSVLPLPAAGPTMNEALLSRLVVAQGLCTREQLRGLLAGRATGDLRPLEELLLSAGIVAKEDLEGLRSGGAPVAPAPPPLVEPTPPGGVPGSSKRGWGAAAVIDEGVGPTVKFGDVLSAQVAAAKAELVAAPPPTDAEEEAAGESTLSFDRVISPLAPPPAQPPSPPPTAPPSDPERPFSASQMEWGRVRGATAPPGAVGSDDDSASTSGERSSERLRLHDHLVRAPRGPSPWRFLVPVALVALGAVAGARLVAWSRQRRRAEWRVRVDAALGHVAQGDGTAALAALPDEGASGSSLDAVDAARCELARGAAQILSGDAGPGLVALGRGDAALPGLEPALARTIERLRARALVALGRGAEAVVVLDALLARAKDDFAALELLAAVELDLGRLDAAARHLEAAAVVAPDEAGRARALRRAVDLAFDAGDPLRALAALDRAGGSSGRGGGALAVARGDVAFVLGRLPQASEHYAEALADATAADAARLGLARTSIVLGDLARARELLDAAAPGPARELLRAGLATAAGRPLDALALVTGLGDDPAARALAGNLQLSLGDARAALACLEALEPRDGGLDRLCRALRARARLLQGDLEAARTEVDLLKRATPSTSSRAPVRPRLLLLGAAPLTAADVAALDAILLGELALATEPLAPEAARAALAAAPTSPRAQLVLGLLERRASDLGAARVALTEAAALAPRDPAPRLELARVLLAQGALDPARAALDEAVALDPAAPTPRLERAELLLRLGDPDGAGEDLRRCHGAVDPLRLLVLQARVAGARGAAAEAADRWLAALRLDPDDPRLLGEAARACGAAGRLEQAERLLGRLADQHPSDPGVQLGRARLLLDRGQLEPALEAATRAAQLGLPTSEDAGAAHVLRAVALLRLGRADEAGAALDEAAKTGETADGLVVRALVVVHGATPATVEACATRARALLDRTLALDLTVSAATVLSRDGQRHAEAGRPVPAELAFRLALERDRAFLDAHHGLVRLHVARGDWRGALEAAGRLLAEHPDDPTGREALALAEKRLGR